MITKFIKYNESIKSLLVGPTKEEVWNYYMEGDLKGLLKTIPDSPEDFFNQMKDDCVKIGSNSYGDIYGKNNVNLFLPNFKNGYLFVSYEYIWSILENIYGINKNEIKYNIESFLVGDIKWGGLVPYSILKNQFTYNK